MASHTLPTLFLSHGSPTTPLEDIPARGFWSELGAQYRGVQAVLCISAHWETGRPAVNAVTQPETIHDFYGFPQGLYRIRYPAHGAPDLAAHVADLLQQAGLACDIDRQRGLDHGAWIPLMTMFPQAEVPVLQLSILHSLEPAQHLAVGEALAALRDESVLILGSGGAVHPLGYWFPEREDAPTDRWASAFDEWLTAAVTQGDRESLVRYRELAPYPGRAHPRPDHYMPLLTALGAAGPGAKGKVIHRSWYWGDLGMAAYEFDG